MQGENTALGKALGAFGFIVGAGAVLDTNEDAGLAALIVGIIVGAICLSIGNVLSRAIAVAVTAAIAFGTVVLRRALFSFLVGGAGDVVASGSAQGSEEQHEPALAASAAPSASAPSDPEQVPLRSAKEPRGLVAGSDQQGPVYSKEAVYRQDGTEFRFGFLHQNVAAAEEPTVSSIQRLVAEHNEQLHVTSASPFYALLKPGQIVIFKVGGTYSVKKTGEGIGTVLQGDPLRIVRVLDGSGARAAGLLKADMIVEVEDKATANLSLIESVGLIQGEPGTPVRLTIVRPSTGQRFGIAVTRSRFQYDHVETETPWIAVSRSRSGTFSYMRSEDGIWKVLELAEVVRAQWDVGAGTASMELFRPNDNHDSKGREIDYRFFVGR